MRIKEFIKEHIVGVIGMTFPILLAASFLALRAFSVSRIPLPEYDLIFASERTGASVGSFVVENGKTYIKIEPFRIAKEEAWPRLFRYRSHTETVDEIAYARPDISFQKVRDYSRSEVAPPVMSVQIDPNNLPTEKNARMAVEISSRAGRPPESVSFVITELANERIEKLEIARDGYAFNPFVRRSAPNVFYSASAYGDRNAYGPALVNGAKTIPISVSADYEGGFYAVGWVKP